MSKEDERSPIDAAAVDAAITRVLKAEREGQEAVNRCAREAEALIEQARQQARQIARRAAHRAVRVQRWSAGTLSRMLDEIDAQRAQIAVAAPAGPPQRLQRAVDELAAQLTGGSS